MAANVLSKQSRTAYNGWSSNYGVEQGAYKGPNILRNVKRDLFFFLGGGVCSKKWVHFISYSKIFLIFGTLRRFTMTTNLFVIANVKQLRSGGSFRTLLPFFRTSWGVGVLNSAIFNSFHNRCEFGSILEGLRNFGGGGSNTPTPPPSVP